MTTWRRVVCWISKDTRAKAHARPRAPTTTHAHTHAHKYIILIAFPRQESFLERSSLLRYTHIAWLGLE